MKSKTRTTLAWIISGLACLPITAGAMMKLAAVPTVVQVYSGIGLLPYMKMLGIAELLFIALFLWQRSSRIGFCLLTGYLGGAMAVELSHGSFFLVPGIILSVVWIAAYLRDPSLFNKEAKKQFKMYSSESFPTPVI